MADKPTYYWDACMFYEVLGNEDVDPQKRARTDEILSDNEKKENLIITSVISAPRGLAGQATREGG